VARAASTYKPLQMPFVSQAQEKKFRELVATKQMKQSVYDEWLKATPDLKKLPIRLKKK
jgi:hypothetical protein